jgi:glycosyltransferase involved in cell wall biosynthesis
VRNKIIIIAPFINFPSESGFNRFFYIANLLSSTNDVTLVTSNFSHFLKTRRDLISVAENVNFKTEFVNEFGYKSNFSLKRFLSILSCEINIILWVIKNKNKIVGSTLYCAYPLILYNIYLNIFCSKIYKRLFIDVQDIWPHSLSSVLKNQFFFKIILDFFKFSIFNSFSRTESFFVVSATYANYFSNFQKTVPRHIVYIGGDFDYIQSIPANTEENNSIVRFFYIGTLSFSYDLETAIKVFNYFKESGVNYELHIFGRGPDEENLKKIANTNIKFHGNLAYEDMVSRCKSCDVALNLIAEGAPQSVTNKLSDYLLLNKLIISSKGCEEVNDLVKFSGGEIYLPGSKDSLIGVINHSILNNLHINRKFNFDILNLFDRSLSYSIIFNKLNG